MDRTDKYLVITKYLSIGSIFFYITKYESVVSIGSIFLTITKNGSVVIYMLIPTIYANSNNILYTNSNNILYTNSNNIY